MAIRIVPKFNSADIAKMMKAKVKIIKDAILQRLEFIGETFVANARTSGNYKDQTGNLRSSIGYVILYNGEQIYKNFERQSVTGSDGKKKRSYGKDGVKVAKSVADEVAKDFPKGYVLIVVAGMDYAAAVESKNYDVLTSSSLIAEQDLKNAIDRLTEKIGRARK